MHPGHIHKPHFRHWYFWVFGGLFLMGWLGRTGWMPFLAPFFLIYFFGPFWWKIGQKSTPKWSQTAQHPPEENPNPWTQVQVIYPSEPKTEPLNYAGLPKTCPSCGGPLNDSTIDWQKSERPACGFCGIALR